MAKVYVCDVCVTGYIWVSAYPVEQVGNSMTIMMSITSHVVFLVFFLFYVVLLGYVHWRDRRYKGGASLHSLLLLHKEKKKKNL